MPSIVVPPPFVLALLGTSLTITGRFSADWATKLARELQTYPEAVGPVRVLNLAKGSQTSTSWGIVKAPEISGLKPTHILTEGFAINDCVDSGGGPAVSRAQHILNIQAMVAEWQANIPGVDITLMTMNPVSTLVATLRPALADFYADEIATATTLGVRVLDNYGGVAGGPAGGWPKPMDASKTNGASPFTIALTATNAAHVSGATCNPADKGANLLTNLGDTQVIATTAAAASIRGNTAIGAGKVHIELDTGAAWARFGIGNGAAPTNDYGGKGNNSIVLGTDGNVYRNNVNQGASGFTVTAGDTVGAEIDIPNALIYFMKGATRSAGFASARLLREEIGVVMRASPAAGR